ncbi:hypothetical protein [Chryseobacterium sp. 5_R23647]|uniref:hypothetical protein n=1 Tax=Chryseobacterium sp. 5_R23647 TaxID=2258964 RepID=UPI000E21C353|nr:hypothetical protein [Chryseobacterium sp. 5_R23647]REC39839.1 hypothetical protein DRF69_21250 [Chryseobacterium sp. 5_R23647]
MKKLIQDNVEALPVYIAMVLIVFSLFAGYHGLKLIRYTITNHPERNYKFFEFVISVILITIFSTLLFTYK